MPPQALALLDTVKGQIGATPNYNTHGNSIESVSYPTYISVGTYNHYPYGNNYTNHNTYDNYVDYNHNNRNPDENNNYNSDCNDCNDYNNTMGRLDDIMEEEEGSVVWSRDIGMTVWHRSWMCLKVWADSVAFDVHPAVLCQENVQNLLADPFSPSPLALYIYTAMCQGKRKQKDRFYPTKQSKRKEKNKKKKKKKKKK